MDGLLLNTEPIYSQCFDQIFSMSSGVWEESFKTKLLGKREEDVARVCVEEGNLTISIDEFRRLAKEIQMELMSKAPLMAGAGELLRLLHGRVPLALATSSHESIMRLKTHSHQDLFRVFDAIVTGDDPAVKLGKPAPDIFLEAARRINQQPSSCLVFEDSPTGVRAGLAADMTVVWIPDPYLWTKLRVENLDLLENNRVIVVPSLEDFTQKYINMIQLNEL
jgi:HAD superfamily hydrolase (TIGR01509 family)